MMKKIYKQPMMIRDAMIAQSETTGWIPAAVAAVAALNATQAAVVGVASGFVAALGGRDFSPIKQKSLTTVKS